MRVIAAAVRGTHRGARDGDRVIDVGDRRRCVVLGLRGVMVAGRLRLGEVLVRVTMRERHRAGAEAGDEGEHEGAETGGGRPGHAER